MIEEATPTPSRPAGPAVPEDAADRAFAGPAKPIFKDSIFNKGFGLTLIRMPKPATARSGAWVAESRWKPTVPATVTLRDQARTAVACYDGMLTVALKCACGHRGQARVRAGAPGPAFRCSACGERVQSAM